MSEKHTLRAPLIVGRGDPPVPISVQDAVDGLQLWWNACQHPERPYEDGVTCFHDCCTPCTIAAEAAGLHDVVEVMRARILEHGEAAP